MSGLRIGRETDGTVRVAVEADDERREFTVAVLDVAGGTLAWPIDDPARPPTAHLHDPAETQDWLWTIYGPDTAVAVAEAAQREATAERDTASQKDTLVAAERGELAAVAARLAFGHWAARWWPASALDDTPALDADLLGLELAALAHRCQSLLPDPGPDGAAELITAHESGLDRLVGWWATETTPDTAAAIESTLRLVATVADDTGLDSPPLRRLHDALADPTTVQVLPRPTDYALAADAENPPSGRLLAQGTCVNDWRRYPPGFVDAAEDAVTWTAHARGAARVLTVRAESGDTAPAVGARLAADARVDGSPPERLRLDHAGGSWTGHAPLSGSIGAGQDIDVGLYLPGFDPGPGEDASAERDLARRVAEERLAAARAGARPGTEDGPFLAEIHAATGRT